MVTQGTSRDSMILSATVVFPEALAPQIPLKERSEIMHLVLLESSLYLVRLDNNGGYKGGLTFSSHSTASGVASCRIGVPPKNW